MLKVEEKVRNIINEGKVNKSKVIDLGNCGLKEIPSELFELEWVEELILCEEWWHFDEKNYNWIRVRTINQGEENHIETLQPELTKLTNLKKLSIGSNSNFTYLRNNGLSIINSLSSIEYLNLSSPNLTKLPDLNKLNKLKFLDISNTEIKSLKGIENCKEIEYIDIGGTKINDISILNNFLKLKYLFLAINNELELITLEELRDLKYLHLSGFQISNFEFLRKFQLLEYLSLISHEVVDINPISDLKNLKYLAICDSNLEEIGYIRKLKNLISLDLFSNKIKDISSLEELKNLEVLRLSRNKVSDISILEKLTKLRIVDLSFNEVTEIAPIKFLIEKSGESSIDTFKGREEYFFSIDGCPLDKPLLAALKIGKDAVLNYLKQPKQRLFEARVMILGEPRSGKTSLRRKLKNVKSVLPSSIESTIAFEVEVEPFKCTYCHETDKFKLIYHIWDFGGQDYYRLLHQLFVSEQSIYIIVTDTDRNKNEEEIDFWLETINRLSKDKNGNHSPTILFQNAKTNREGNDFSDLKRRYPFWQQDTQYVVNLDRLILGNKNYNKNDLIKFNEFKRNLESSFSKLHHIGKEMPKQWIKVRKSLIKLEARQWIPVEEFNELCEKNGIKKQSDKTDLLDVFHTLGFVLHYKRSSLDGMVILNKEWATDALYRVLDDEIVRHNRGWFKRDDAEKIWHEPKYKNRISELIAIMKEFKLVFYNEITNKYIVPAKLPESQLNFPHWNYENMVRLNLQYDWMPKAITTQLIVSLHDFIYEYSENEQWIWSKGAVLSGKNIGLDNVFMRIEDNWKSNRIELSATGDRSEELIRIVLKVWGDVNRAFEDKVIVTKDILCSCTECVKSLSPFKFKYENVMKAYSINKKLQCQNSLFDLNPKEIFKGIFDDISVKIDLINNSNLFDSNLYKITELLKNNEIEKAIDLLSGTDPNVILFKAKYNRIKSDEILNLVSHETKEREYNRLIHSIIEFIHHNYKPGFYLHKTKTIRSHIFQQDLFEHFKPISSF